MTRAAMLTVLATTGAVLAGCADYYPPPPPPGYVPGPEPYRVHVRRCFRAHPNYDPRTNTWIGPEGVPHPCER